MSSRKRLLSSITTSSRHSSRRSVPGSSTISEWRTAIAKHDGVLSAVRAHDANTLIEAARGAVPGFASGIYGAKIWKTPDPRVFHTLLGIRRSLELEFRSQLGIRAARLGELR